MTNFDTAAMLLDAAYAADEAHHLYFDENLPGWEVSEVDPEDRREVDFWLVESDADSYWSWLDIQVR